MLNRKINLLYLTVAILVFSLLSFLERPAILDAHRVGDVIYSLLEPEDFKTEHGDSWQLLNGETLSNENPLSKYLNKQGSEIERVKDGRIKLPDARGIFLRGIDYGRGQDLDRVSNKQDKIVGIFQDDAFQAHWHALQVIDPGKQGCCNGFPQDFGHSIDDSKVGGTLAFRATQMIKDKSNNNNLAPKFSSYETRPKNISLYIYVKITN
ncbi:MAG: hypothetical protein QM768_18685 [Agriterribacter sp.]